MRGAIPQREGASEPRYHGALRVRLAEERDAASLQTIYAECIRNADWLPVTAREVFDLAAVSVGEEIHLAERADGVIVGFVSVQPEERYIHHLYILEAARGSGVGRQLLAALTLRHPRLWRLKCVRRNHQALAFYRALGWVEIGSGDAEHGSYVVLARSLGHP